MKKSCVFLLAFAALVLTLLLAVGIYAASAPTALPATESAEGYLQMREDGGETYDLRLVVNANKEMLDGYSEAWIDLVFAMPDDGTRSYHGQVDKLFSSTRAAGETFKADASCVLFGVVVTDIPYEPRSASATLTLIKDGTKEETVTLGRIALPQKDTYTTVDGPALHKLITGGQGISDDSSDANLDVTSVTFGNWETYAQELADTDFAAWDSGTDAGVKPDTVRLFRVPKGENEHGTTYDVYILSKTGRVALPEDSSYLLYGLTTMTSLRADDLDTSAMADMRHMFTACNSLTDLTPLADWDVSGVTDMYGMFWGGIALTNLAPLTVWDVSSVTNMSHMFYGCMSLTDFAGLTGWDVSNVTDMNAMLGGCMSLADLTPLASWDVSNVTDMYEMFFGCSFADLAPLAGWDVSSVTNMYEMFRSCKSLTDLTGLSGWDVSNVSNMSAMFIVCSSLADLTPLTGWDVSNVTDMSHMFRKCTALTDLLGLTDWDVSSLTDMTEMFWECSALTVANLSGWNTAHVTDMASVFADCESLTDIVGLAGWDVSSVTNMYGIFRNCKTLTVADLSGWNTANVTNMNWLFMDCSRLETVYVSENFVVPSRVGPSSADGVFKNCTALSGKYWNGSEYVEKTRYQDKGDGSIYNRICTETEDGYLTLKVE